MMPLPTWIHVGPSGFEGRKIIGHKHKTLVSLCRPQAHQYYCVRLVVRLELELELELKCCEKKTLLIGWWLENRVR